MFLTSMQGSEAVTEGLVFKSSAHKRGASVPEKSSGGSFTDAFIERPVDDKTLITIEVSVEEVPDEGDEVFAPSAPIEVEASVEEGMNDDSHGATGHTVDPSPRVDDKQEFTVPIEPEQAAKEADQRDEETQRSTRQGAPVDGADTSLASGSANPIGQSIAAQFASSSLPSATKDQTVGTTETGLPSRVGSLSELHTRVDFQLAVTDISSNAANAPNLQRTENALELGTSFLSRAIVKETRADERLNTMRSSSLQVTAAGKNSDAGATTIPAMMGTTVLNSASEGAHIDTSRLQLQITALGVRSDPSSEFLRTSEITWEVRSTTTGLFDVKSITRQDMPAPVARSIAEALQRAPDGRLEVSLNPAELGRVRMMLTPSENGMAVLVQAERPETLDLMRRNIETLAREMSDLGFETLDFSFSQNGGEKEGEGDDLARQPSSSDWATGVLNETSNQHAASASVGYQSSASLKAEGLDLRV